MFINTGKRLDGYFINTQPLQDLKTVNVDIDLCLHDTLFLFLKGESNEKWREAEEMKEKKVRPIIDY